MKIPMTKEEWDAYNKKTRANGMAATLRTYTLEHYLEVVRSKPQYLQSYLKAARENIRYANAENIPILKEYLEELRELQRGAVEDAIAALSKPVGEV